MDLIVNADDFGMSSPVTDAAVSLMERGRIASATIIANGGDLDRAVAAARQHPECSFGVHLNASEGPPLTGQAGLESILDEDGRFSGAVFSVRPTPSLLRAMVREWVAQVRRIRSMGVQVTHLDSHEHVHTVPWLFPVLKLVQRETGIRRVRQTKTVYDDAQPPKSPLLVRKKKVWSWALRRVVPSVTTDGFADFHSFLLSARARPLRIRTMEVGVHPGHLAVPPFQREIELLEGAWEEDLPFPVRLVNWGQMGRG